MHTNEKGLWRYYCPKCLTERQGLLDSPDYSWSCPRCGLGHYKVEKMKGAKRD